MSFVPAAEVKASGYAARKTAMAQATATTVAAAMLDVTAAMARDCVLRLATTSSEPAAMVMMPSAALLAG